MTPVIHRKSICLAALALCCGGACAQIYAGTSDAGVVTISNLNLAEATVLIVAAPPSTVATTSVAALTVNVTHKASLPIKPITRKSAFAVSPAMQEYIAQASATSQLPAALIHAVIAVESNYNPHAVSSKGAQGLMQLMPATAKRFGGVNSMDARDNILTGSRYLRWLLDHFAQNVELALAAYNAGEGAVVKAGLRIPAYAETQKYVPKVLAHYASFSSV